MRRATLALAGCMLLGAGSVLAIEYRIPLQVATIGPTSFTIKANQGPFTLPSFDDDPRLEGGSVTISDLGRGTSVTETLEATGWSTIGSHGYKYRGDPCRAVVKTNVVKVTCRYTAIPIQLPTMGALAARLRVGSGTTDYCGECGGTTIRNDDRRYKAKNCIAPSACNASPSGAFVEPPTPLL